MDLIVLLFALKISFVFYSSSSNLTNIIQRVTIEYLYPYVIIVSRD